MGKTIQGLMIEEASLMQLVNVITEGLKTAEVSEQVRTELEHWCEKMTEYSEGLQELGMGMGMGP